MRIHKYPEDSNILHKQVEEVTVFDLELQKLVKQMFKKMHKNEGIGLAANQVGLHKDIFVMHINKKTVCINARIKKATAEVEFALEGCLSCPGKAVEVARRKQITLAYYDEYGNDIIKSFRGLEARCVQHEMDHLAGKLIIDYDKNKT
jgi:peptide deformylase